MTGTNGYFTTLTGTTSYSTLKLTGGITAGTGYFTTMTGTNSYVSSITGNTGTLRILLELMVTLQL